VYVLQRLCQGFKPLKTILLSEMIVSHLRAPFPPQKSQELGSVCALLHIIRRRQFSLELRFGICVAEVRKPLPSQFLQR
jgi:hypothetical protein